MTQLAFEYSSSTSEENASCLIEQKQSELYESLLHTADANCVTRSICSGDEFRDNFNNSNQVPIEELTPVNCKLYRYA